MLVLLVVTGVQGDGIFDAGGVVDFARHLEGGAAGGVFAVEERGVAG